MFLTISQRYDSMESLIEANPELIAGYDTNEMRSRIRNITKDSVDFFTTPDGRAFYVYVSQRERGLKILNQFETFSCIDSGPIHFGDWLNTDQTTLYIADDMNLKNCKENRKLIRDKGAMLTKIHA